MEDFLLLLLAMFVAVLLILWGLGSLYSALYLRPRLKAAREQEQRNLEELYAKLKTLDNLHAQNKALQDIAARYRRRLAELGVNPDTAQEP